MISRDPNVANIDSIYAKKSEIPSVPAPLPGFRNAIINGGFDIWQRNISSITLGGYNNADRWWGFSTGIAGGRLNVARTTLTPSEIEALGYSAKTCVRIFNSSSTPAVQSYAQRIEGVHTFAGQTVTVSFFYQRTSSQSAPISVSLLQVFGTGGTPSSTTTTNLSNVNIGVTANQWTRYTATVTLPSINGKVIGTNNDDYLQLNLNFGNGSSARTDIFFWGFQVEAGNTATRFEQRPIGVELQLCQRYYWRTPTQGGLYSSYGHGVSQNGGTSFIWCPFPVQMRTAPSSVSYSSLRITDMISGGTAITAVSMDYPNSWGTTLQVSHSTFGSGGQHRFLQNNNIATGFLEFLAEL